MDHEYILRCHQCGRWHLLLDSLYLRDWHWHFQLTPSMVTDVESHVKHHDDRDRELYGGLIACSHSHVLN